MSLGSQALTGFTLFLKDVRPCYLAHHNATEEDANRFLAAVWEAMCPPAKEVRLVSFPGPHGGARGARIRRR